MAFLPTPDDKFTFGLWTVGNPGRDPFGEPTRAGLAPAEIVELLDEAGGALGVNFHDNDLVPIDATQAEAATIKKDFAAALERTGLRVCMATTNLFGDPVFKDGAFTSNDADVRAYAVHKTMHAMDLGAEFGADVYVMWGGREGCETDAAKDPVESLNRYRDAVNFLCGYNAEKGYNFRFALEPKPNEPRGHIFLPTIGHCLAFIASLEHPDMVGVNPEVAHEHMAGLNFTHAVAMTLWAGKLFHIDLNDQAYGRYDQDFRFGSESPKAAFFLVKLLEDHGYSGYRHFDSHAYRTSDRADVIEFARGSMRTYLMLKDAAKRWNADAKIKEFLASMPQGGLLGKGGAPRTYSPGIAAELHGRAFDRAALASRPLPYEALDQRTIEILLGA
ncbi:MAG: xylose isomerase [Phycisphaeraceae bacterium]|nr:MAG: xylose isomerase [Phycisphaeraceae bacterium]